MENKCTLVARNVCLMLFAVGMFSCTCRFRLLCVFKADVVALTCFNLFNLNFAGVYEIKVSENYLNNCNVCVFASPL